MWCSSMIDVGKVAFGATLAGFGVWWLLRKKPEQPKPAVAANSFP